MSRTKRFSVEAVAAWLEAADASCLWGTDGEAVLGQAISMPCTGADLAAAFRRVGGDVDVQVPSAAAADSQIQDLVFEDDGVTTLAMRWPGDREGDIWLLREDVLAEDALRVANEAFTAA